MVNLFDVKTIHLNISSSYFLKFNNKDWKIKGADYVLS